jgi:hypothetical protein
MIAKKLSEAKEYVAPNHRACTTLPSRLHHAASVRR